MTTVLVIDDSEAIPFAVQSAVPSWTVLHAEDGLAGIDLARRLMRQLDLVVLDVQMPNLDGRATCLKLRELAPSLPILPFTAFTEERTLSMFRELGCLPPLIKPAAPDALAAALHQAIGQPPPPIAPGLAVLDYARELVDTAERERRDARAPAVAIYAQSRTRRTGLQSLVEAAGARVVLLSAHLPPLAQLLATRPLTALVCPAGETVALLPLCETHACPLLAIVETLTEALVLTELDQAATVPLGAVVDSDSDVLPTAVAEALRQLAASKSALPASVLRPFAQSPLSAQEQALLLLELRGLAAREIAEQLGIARDSVRQYRARMVQKLGLAGEGALAEWAATWWRAHA